ncbi:putative for curly fiber subunit based on high copy number in virion [Leptolyngbya boryana NIES-2135]|jgi:hypothetical protein|uniref:Putative for curly fiber subunit based on high copy number in virion n=1 Tax=Leptolyngbya boryana NIES-2135 TaxID=1973484 RepID=A0A1Z4JPC8_LEPBY|nr:MULTISPECIES: hypothetical protein [Leptolyngbya]BAY58498.1 putative for curly fiber subunit based on high copy number in virion [Leptolyngbya boryana NIES-2135]MBD2370973.1 hypothetical protein [Leptolyngbya sp. FACHB-161]MBD2377487.1 hypothetical protein [Leptolyngbya sp. FACHB-238]MBD2401895.1 hypothetical protein [Leptolyngbya sp. FACHB-239]MBD2408413.1 hypothetical protein [Leptolyngbya sp. FACHB-402]
MSFLTPAKHIDKIIAASIRLSGVSAAGNSTVVTSQITTALSTAGDKGVSVPLQISSSGGLGVIVTPPSNRCEIYNATSKDKISSASGEEVYARLTQASGVYTLSFYTLENNGTETAYSFGSSTPIDIEFNYRFDFRRLPADAIIGIPTRNISEDPTTPTGQTLFREKLNVTGTNTIDPLSKTPVNATAIFLIVNQTTLDAFGGSTAAFAVNLSTKEVTWNPANAGYDLDTTDRVIAVYSTIE